MKKNKKNFLNPTVLMLLPVVLFLVLVTLVLTSYINPLFLLMGIPLFWVFKKRVEIFYYYKIKSILENYKK
jgi:hypothetical protein